MNYYTIAHESNFCCILFKPKGKTTSNAVSANTVTDGSTSQIPKIMVKLSNRPPDLYVLWREYEFGLTEGQKRARDYTSAERGANKASFCRRKKFWDLVDLLIRRGSDSDTAIDRIYTVYGKNSNVTKILNELARDSMNKINRFG